MWKNTDNVVLDNTDQIERAMRQVTSASTYRSRTPLNLDLLKYAAVSQVVVNEHLEFKALARHDWVIRSAPRSSTEVVSTVNTWRIAIATRAASFTRFLEHNPRAIDIITGVSSDAKMSELVSAYENHGYAITTLNPQLITTPNHTMRILYKVVQGVACFIFLTSMLNDSILLKITGYFTELDNNVALAEAIYEYDYGKFTTILNDKYRTRLQAVEEERFNNTITECVQTLSSKALTVTDNSINSTVENVQQYESRITELYKELTALRLQRIAIEQTGANKYKEFQEYILKFRRNAVLDMRAYSHEYMEVIFKTELLYWDNKVLDIYLEGSRSNVILNAKTWVKQLLIEILHEKIYTFQFTTKVLVPTLPGPSVRNSDSNSIPRTFPHPHVHYYNCFGDNKTHIQRAVSNQDYIVVFEQIIAALSGLNLTDSTVLSKFVNVISNSPNSSQYDLAPCLKVNATGEIITLLQYRQRVVDQTQSQPQPQPIGGNPFR